MSYLGKQFVVESQENFDAFIDFVGHKLPDNVKKSMVNFKSAVKLVKNGDQYTLITSQPDGDHEATFTPGVEFTETVFGNTCKTKPTLEGNTLTIVQQFDNDSLTYKREFSDNKLVVTITGSSWDGVAKRIYKAA